MFDFKYFDEVIVFFNLKNVFKYGDRERVYEFFFFGNQMVEEFVVLIQDVNGVISVVCYQDVVFCIIIYVVGFEVFFFIFFFIDEFEVFVFVQDIQFVCMRVGVIGYYQVFLIRQCYLVGFGEKWSLFVFLVLICSGYLICLCYFLYNVCV